jgi:cysteinyl-tRNA synthetase
VQARDHGTTMELRLYDTLTREKRIFAPLDPAHVRMYVCGPTVYDYAHIGNARPVIVFDVLFRLLRHLYGAEHVTYVRNITDVDDKINARAAEEYPDLPLNDAIRKVTEKTDRQFHEDVAALGALPPTVEPRATEHIAEMRAMIERLIASGNAYVADEHVLFSVPSMPDYGRLSKRPLDEMIAGARVEVAPYKRDPQDFVLWKPSKPGEPAWPSPAGIATPGRPGWHIECSAMSWKYLGEVFDIHGGGIDLVFPHHENEIAQSRCTFHTPAMANVWMHNGFLQVEGEKMSKSLGNFVTIHQLLRDWHGYSWPGDALRFNMLRTHYRQPIDWTFNSLDESHKILWEWYEDIEGLQSEDRLSNDALYYLCDDLNTSQLITELHGLRRRKDFQTLFSVLRFLGFSGDKSKILRSRVPFVQNNTFEAAAQVVRENQRQQAEFAEKFGSWVVNPPLPPTSEEIGQLIANRNAARARKDWEEADRIRDQLFAMGIRLKDNPDGTTTPEMVR